MTEACQNCKAHGGIWVKRRQGDKGEPRYWTACRVGPPSISSLWIGKGPDGDAWAGVHPWVPYDYWCTSWVAGEDSTATQIVLGKAESVDKPVKD